MKSALFGFLLCLLFFAFLFIGLDRMGREPRHDATGDDAAYLEALESSAAQAQVPSPEQLTAWVEGVEQAFTPFSVENVKTGFPKAYAEELYFRDAFHTYTDRAVMLDYMIKSAEMSQDVTFEFSAPVQNGMDVYLPWVMLLGGRDPVRRSLGISHLRFNAEGQVIFHQDYWDSADVVVPVIPVANGIVEAVRRQF